jgi:Na+/serine symporter
MIVKVLVASVKTETSHAENVKTVIVRVGIVKKVQTVVLIVLVVNSLMHHQNSHSVQKRNEFVLYA